jgi:hypothetical protein
LKLVLVNVHSTGDLNRHTGGERKIVRDQRRHCPPTSSGVPQRLMGVKPSASSLSKRSRALPVMGVWIKPDRISYTATPCQGDNDAAAGPAHATRHSCDSTR